ncbi:hypothetical protein Goari_022812 [Gossypium aridum]|uniref:Reverse transcriptase zinc-binding domain-containing protein n=1 Tax=Gossypium aridum TaxID=34290 RepID=A0A7J8YMB3_GOSAI|nr:hypothetical protein [Gossypium aridum]
MIVYTYPEDVAEMILSIPLVERPHEDFQVWSAEASSEYTVRSAYKLLQSIEDDPRAYALQTDYNDFYKNLWLLDLPAKIKITAWKISWNFLAIRANMLLRRLTSTSVCPRCGSGTETMNHLFYGVSTVANFGFFTKLAILVSDLLLYTMGYLGRQK